MYTIKLEWIEWSQKQQQEISLTRIIDLGRHHSAFVPFNDLSVARRHAIIYPDRDGAFLQCIDKNAGIGMDCGRILAKGESVQLQAGMTFCIGSVKVSVVSITSAPVQRRPVSVQPRWRTSLFA